MQSVEQEQAREKSFFARIKKGLSRTGQQFSGGLSDMFLGKKLIDDELLEDIETLLLTSDVGLEATTDIVEALTAKVSRKELTDAAALHGALKEELAALLHQVEEPLNVRKGGHRPFVILVVGVNGVGKTTTIGKMASLFQSQGRSVVLAAGDTFRAAAVEQLEVWGERNDITVVSQGSGADSASVIFDALQLAKSRDIEVVIADTAGRLHNKDNLMNELEKVKRVIGKFDALAPHEILLVLDAGTGQNALVQAEQFSSAVNLTGLALTKLDGTARGGVIFSLAKKLGIPVRFIGVGESIEDLQPFKARTFIDALFDKSKS